MIIIKTDSELALMREAGRIIAVILSEIEERIKPGVTTLDLDQWAEERILQLKAKPAFKGYRGKSSHRTYPATLCTSINEEVVHGIPSKDRVLKEGDIIGIDVGTQYKEYYSDGAWTYAVGEISQEARLLMDACRTALYEGVKEVYAGNWLGNVSRVIDRSIRAKGFEIVRDLSGHGIGRNLHEEPSILNFDNGEKGLRLKENMTLAIEPMITAGSYAVEVLQDQWTVVTVDRSLSAHYEHTVAITANGAEIMTRL